METYRRPDGRRWSGQAIDKVTGGIVTRSYVTNLRKGRMENPGLEKMRAIAKAMGFPPEMWFEEDLGSEAGRLRGRRGEASLVGLSISSRPSRILRAASPTRIQRWPA
jgi:transcriptional regulator with XRE-family HTH domain